MIKHILCRRSFRPHAIVFFLLVSFLLSGCSTNPATGEQQFTALMPPRQEQHVGAREHQKVVAEYGLYQHPDLQRFVQDTGARVTRNTERPDVRYSFYLLDTPMVNAFALPGGYIYITRGLLALANSEAEVAAVLAHETGHITARHSAERYSRGVVTMLGAALLSTAVGDSNVSDALGVGADLYMRSYSRGQENEADTLGLRYLSRAGYDPRAMTDFLRQLQSHNVLEARMNDADGQGNLPDYMSTHPATQERVTRTISQSAQFASSGEVGRDSYLRRISGMIYGESAAQGFVRGRTFYHTEMGFQFSVPDGFRLYNQPQQVVALSKDGGVIVFDFLVNPDSLSPAVFMREEVLKGDEAEIEAIEINGFTGVTSSIRGKAGKRDVLIRLIILPWGDQRMVRFQVAYPAGYGKEKIEALRASTYSFRRISAEEGRLIRPYRVISFTARPGDTVSGVSAKMPMDSLARESFVVLNGLRAGEELVTGRMYKTISE